MSRNLRAAALASPSANSSTRAGIPAAVLIKTLRTSVVVRTGSVTLAIGVAKLLTLVSLGYAARVLGPQNWGLVGAALAVVAYASVVLWPGLMAWGTREIARDRSRTPAVLVIVNLTQLALAVCTYLGVLTFSQALHVAPAELWVIAISATALFAQALSVDWVFDGLEQPQIAARLQMLGSAARLAAVVWLCRGPSDLLVYAALLPLSTGVQAIVGSLLLARRGLLLCTWPGFAELREGLIAAWPLGLSTSLFLIVHNANTLIVEGWLGSGQAGQYLAALRVVEMASVLPGVLAIVFRPRMARLCSIDRPAAAREARLYERAHLLAGFLLASLLYGESARVVACLYGPQYVDAIPLLRIFSAAVAANYLVCGSTNCLQAFGGDRSLLRAISVAALVSIGAGVVLTPWYGVSGAALAASLIHPVTWLVALPAYRRAVGGLAFRTWARPLAAAAAIVALSWWREQYNVGLVVSVAAYSLAYLVIAGRCWIEMFEAAATVRPSA